MIAATNQSTLLSATGHSQPAHEPLPAPARPLGIAVLGCGYWGVNYLRVFNELSGSQVAVICDLREERLREVGRRLPDARLTTQIDDALSAPEVDAVVVCTEATTHHTIARRCLEAGKHVLVEKPMTTTVSHAQDLVAVAAARSRVLMVGHVFVFNAGIRKVKEYLTRDRMGELYYLSARRTNLGPIRRDVNALWDLAAHDIAIFNYLLDDYPEWVSAVGSKVLKNGHEDVGFVAVAYPSGIVGHMHVSWADPNKVREVVVVGSEARIVFDDLNAGEQVRIYEKGVAVTRPAPQQDPAANAVSDPPGGMATYGEYHFRMRDGDIISPKVEVSEPLKSQCSHFLDCIRQGSQPLTSGLEGLRVVEVMSAIDRSIALRGAPVQVQSDEARVERMRQGEGYVH